MDKRRRLKGARSVLVFILAVAMVSGFISDVRSVTYITLDSSITWGFSAYGTKLDFLAPVQVTSFEFDDINNTKWIFHDATYSGDTAEMALIGFSPPSDNLTVSSISQMGVMVLAAMGTAGVPSYVAFDTSIKPVQVKIDDTVIPYTNYTYNMSDLIADPDAGVYWNSTSAADFTIKLPHNLTNTAVEVYWVASWYNATYNITYYTENVTIPQFTTPSVQFYNFTTGYTAPTSFGWVGSTFARMYAGEGSWGQYVIIGLPILLMLIAGRQNAAIIGMLSAAICVFINYASGANYYSTAGLGVIAFVCLLALFADYRSGPR